MTVDNPLATIREDPAPFAQDIRRVPAGTYQVTEWTMESFAGESSRWLRIRVDADLGWIEHDAMSISGRSSECDF